MKKLLGILVLGLLFVSSSAAREANLELNEGDAVTFEVENGEKGPSAVNLQKA